MGDADHTQSTSRAQEGKRAQEGNEHKRRKRTTRLASDGESAPCRVVFCPYGSPDGESCVARASSSRHVSVSGVRIFVAQESD